MFDFRSFINALVGKKSGDPVGDLKSATIWVQELPEADIHRAQSEIIKALVSINDNKKTTLKERIRVLLYLDEKARGLQEILCREYLLHADRPDAQEKFYLPTILGFWNEMGAAYQICIRAFAEGPAGSRLRSQLPLLTARALRNFAMQAKWSYIRYLPVEATVWRTLNRLYRFAEREQFHTTPVSLYPNLSDQTTCTAEFVHPLMLYAANPENLLPMQIEMVDKWLDSWAKSISLESDFRPHRQLYAVNLSDTKPARRLRRNMLGEKYRYWGVGLLLVLISKTIEQLKNGELPVRLKLGEDCRLPACLDLIELIAKRWAGQGGARKHDRQPNVRVVQVVQGLMEIMIQLKPGAAKSRRPMVGDNVDYQIMPGTDAAAGHKLNAHKPSAVGAELFEPATEQWMMENESLSGYGASLNASNHGRSNLKIGMLIGLKPEAKKQFALGVARRIQKNVANKTYVGIQTLTQAPVLVHLHPVPGQAKRSNSIDAIYVPESVPAKIDRSLLVPPEAFARGKLMELRAQGRAYTIRLEQILEQSDDYARVSFDVLAKN